MLYSESDNVCDAMAQAAHARGAKSALLANGRRHLR